MTETEKAYMTGIIGGKGSIMLEKIHNNQHHSPIVSITSTTLELLEWIKSKINKGKITKKTNYNIEKHKDCYIYVIRYNNALS